jgi:hypothetical protein
MDDGDEEASPRGYSRDRVAAIFGDISFVLCFAVIA